MQTMILTPSPETLEAVKRYFEAEPAAMVTTIEQRDLLGILIGFVVIDRAGNRWSFDAERESDAAIVAEARAETMARELAAAGLHSPFVTAAWALSFERAL